MANQQRPRRHAGPSSGLAKRWLVRLGLLLAIFLALLVLVGSLVLHLPASVLGRAVAKISHGQIKLVLPAGKIGSGRAELWVRDASKREWKPWMPIEWEFLPIWQVKSPALVLSSSVGIARLDGSGINLTDIDITIPPNLLLSGIDHPLADAPWRGDIDLMAKQIACTWENSLREIPVCDGQATMLWRGVGSTILPLQEVGSYAVSILARSQNGGTMRADISTDSGEVTLTGFAEVNNGSVSYRLIIKARNELISGLGSIAGPGLRQIDDSGVFLLEK